MTGLRRRVPLVVVALLTMLAAGCGVRPSAVIAGGAAPAGPIQGVGLYFVVEQRLTLVLRPSTPPGSVDDALALLLAGPERRERQQGYRTEIPVDAGPAVTRSEPSATPEKPSGTTVNLGTDVTALSTTAIDQIVCTVWYALADGSPAQSATITLTGPDGRRGPYGCDPPDCPAPAPAPATPSPGAARCLPPDLGPGAPVLPAATASATASDS